MSRERFFCVLIEVTEENDGWTYMRHGAEERKEVVSVEEAAKTYGHGEIANLLRLCLSHLEPEEKRIRESVDALLKKGRS